MFYWETDPDLTKYKQSHPVAFTHCIWMQRGMRQAIAVSLLETCLFISSVFTLYLRMMWFLGLYSVSQRERNTDRMGMSKFRTRITFPTDPSDFVTALYCGHNVVFMLFWLWQRPEFLFLFFLFLYFPTVGKLGSPQRDGEDRGEHVSVKWNAPYLLWEVPPLCGLLLKEK